MAAGDVAPLPSTLESSVIGESMTTSSQLSTAASADRIFLRGLAVECIIGFIDWERRVKQTIVIDLEFPVDCRAAARTDEVADTVDYKAVAKRVIAFVEASEFKLVETLAHRLAMLMHRGVLPGVGAPLREQARRHPRVARCGYHVGTHAGGSSAPSTAG